MNDHEHYEGIGPGFVLAMLVLVAWLFPIWVWATIKELLGIGDR